MTRANLNFLYSEKGKGFKTLFTYWNGDQYPEGLVNHYNIKELFDDPTPKGFRAWIKRNYEGAKVTTIKSPYIYYTEGHITDYSYVFDLSMGELRIKVFSWDQIAFSGSPEEFIQWAEKWGE